MLTSCAKTDRETPEIRQREVLDDLEGRILYRTGHNDIVLKDWTGRSKTVGTSAVSGAQWSPDGSRFCIVEDSEHAPCLCLFDREGTGTDRWELSGLAAGDIGGFSWSPDGKYVTLLVSGNQLRHVETATGDISVITLHPVQPYTTLAWSPANQKLTLAEGRNIWLVDPFTDNALPTLLLSDQEPDPIESMKWNPGGTMLVFSGGTAESKVKVADMDGKNIRILNARAGGETGPVMGAAPCWYNDHQIIYVRLYKEKIYWNIGLFMLDGQKESDVYLNIRGFDPDCS